MNRLVRVGLAISLISLAAWSMGQGSAAGYGRGGLGGDTSLVIDKSGVKGQLFRSGTFTTGNVPAMSASEDLAKRPEEQAGEWQTKTSVLTPGDRVEVKVTMRAGETVLAGVTSDAFDPALAVVDSSGAEVAKNDDREPGDQSPFIAYRFTHAGDYALRVLSSSKVAGGKFVLKYRSFVSMDAGTGPRDYVRPALGDSDAANRLTFRLTAVKGRIYDLASASLIQGRSTLAMQLVGIVGPTGVPRNDFKTIPTPDGSTVFEALADGDFYLQYAADDTGMPRSDFREVAVQSVKDTCSETLDFASGELKLIEFPVSPSQIIRTYVSGGPHLELLSAPEGRGVDETDMAANGTTAGWSWFLPNVGNEDDQVRVFRGKGTARMAIRVGRGMRPVHLKFENSEGLPAWTPKQDTKGALAIGECKLLTISTTKSELMHVMASSTHFLARLDIFRMSGELANSLIDRQKLTAADDLYFPDPGTFIIRMSCEGNGGAGEFVMRRDTLPAEPYVLGTVHTMKLDGGNFGLFDVNLEAGKRYELLYDRKPDLALRTDLLDVDGQFLDSSRQDFDSVTVEYFVPAKSGVHRLWLRGDPGTYQFRLGVNVPPTVAKG